MKRTLGDLEAEMRAVARGEQKPPSRFGTQVGEYLHVDTTGMSCEKFFELIKQSAARIDPEIKQP